MDKSTGGGEQEMGMVWVKEERIGLEEDCLERKEKLS